MSHQLVRAKAIRFVLFATALSILSLMFAPPISPASAAEARNFNPGNIISDQLFYDGNSMGAAEVQSFLNTQIPRCTIGDPGRTPGTTFGSSVIAENCLRDYSIATNTRAANEHCLGYSGSSRESAAQIIAKVGAACGISPKVLLVMLEKEQSLVSDTWPTVRQINVAMGYACPDSGPNNSANCDSNYFGFFNQVYRAAWQLKVYKAYPNSFNYRPHVTNTIQWHPNAGCGTSQVYIENSATAALYIYTPYRPNQAALNNLYGTGDSCSTYGNRNFWRMYTDWFGSSAPQVDPFGNVDSVVGVPGGIQIRGWAIDPNTSDPIDVHVYVNGEGRARSANIERPDIGLAYPGSGSRHGFDAFVPYSVSGNQQACIYAINSGPGSNALIGCKSFTSFAGGSPSGELVSVSGADGRISVFGWAGDPDRREPIDVRVSIDGDSVLTKANAEKPQPPAAFGYFGPNRGFSVVRNLPEGNHRVCVVALNVGLGADKDLGCRDVEVLVPKLPDLGRMPFGSLDSVGVAAGKVTVSGWAIDADTANPIDVHVYVGAKGTSVKADSVRNDLVAHYPAYGPNHGYVREITGVSGTQNVCIYAIDNGGKGNTLLGCRTVTIP